MTPKMTKTKCALVSIASAAIQIALTGSQLLTLTAHADIIGGEEVGNQTVSARAKHPFDPIRESTAALYKPSPDGRGGALCTASLIGKNTAITAAHCVAPLTPGQPKPVMIFGNNVRAESSIKREVSQVAVNPKWNTHAGRGMDQGDIALVKFKGGIPKGYRPTETLQTESGIRPGKTVTLAGYGISNARDKSGAGVLRKTRVKVTDARAGKSEMIFDQSHGHGACHGDSGGPAYVRSGGKSVLAGITNRSYPNNAPDDCGHKVVYTKVSAYQPWIKKTEKKFESGNEGDMKGQLTAKTVAESKANTKTKTIGKKIAKTVQKRLHKTAKISMAKPAARKAAKHEVKTHKKSARIAENQNHQSRVRKHQKQKPSA